MHPGARPIRSDLMDCTSVSRSLSFGDQERLLYVTYLPPYIYEDATHDGEAIVTALFEVPNLDGMGTPSTSTRSRGAVCSTASPRRAVIGAGP